MAKNHSQKHIEFPLAYQQKVQENIVANAQKTFCRTVEDHEEILAWLDANGHIAHTGEPQGFAESLWYAYHIAYGKLTEKQCDAVRKCIAREAEWAAQKEAKKAEWAKERENAEDVPEGRAVITGAIIGEKIVDSQFGQTRKITVKDDRGFIVYGTIARAIEDKIIDDFYDNEYEQDENAKIKFVGVRITFAAAITPSDDDPKFGFYKRPTKAQII